MARNNNKKINIKNIEKFTLDSNDRTILWKKVLKNSEEVVINKKFIDDVFALDTNLEKKFKFFYYLFELGSFCLYDPTLIREKFCDSSTWNHQRLSKFQVSLLVDVVKTAELNLYVNDKNDIRYIDKIEIFLKEESDFEEIDFYDIGFRSLRRDVYKDNIDDYFKELIKLDSEELKETILKIFGDVNTKFYGDRSFLSFCQELFSAEDVLETSKTFLEMGVNPNASDCSGYYEDNMKRHVLSTSIIKGRNTDFICSMLEEFMWHGLNVHAGYPIIFKDLIKCGYSYEDNLEIFKVIYKNSFNKVDVYKLSFPEENEYAEISDKLKMISQAGLIVDLIYKKFKSNNYELDKNYHNIALNVIEELALIIEVLRAMLSSNKIEELIYETVIKNREQYLNTVDSKIDFSEIMEAIKTIKDEKIDEINNNFNKCNEKVLTYKK